jgi:hypothetical protein
VNNVISLTMLFEIEGTSGNRKGKFVIASSGGGDGSTCDGVGSGGGGGGGSGYYGGGGGEWDAWCSEGCVRRRGRWGLRCGNVLE